jgi:subtilisin family serine protease
MIFFYLKKQLFSHVKQRFNVKKQYLIRAKLLLGYKKKNYFYFMKKNLLLTIFACILFGSIISQETKKWSEDTYLNDRIIIKIKPSLKSACHRDITDISSINVILERYHFSSMEQKFPSAISPRSGKAKETDISTIYTVLFPENSPLKEIIQDLSALPEVEYAQLHYIPVLLYTPNDPLISEQWHLTLIRAYDAWNISKGDPSVVIGISDTGTDYAHPDLVDNIAYNLNDIINGIDDDNDGFTDNFRGWDLGNNDNSAQWNESGTMGDLNHGVYVCGFAASSTDNVTGTAAPGFNCRFLPVKINNSNGLLVASYESIVYAADHGCRIINCSWGGISPHPFGQDIINYATFNRNALVVAAAGNNGHTTNDIYYPCAFENVLCVAASNVFDEKWNKSCYGYHVDLTAPGQGVFGPAPDNGYLSSFGTSFASPIAASVAALILAHHQDTLSPFQITHIIKNSCDNIDTVPANISFAGKLGNGRINAYNALTLPWSSSLDFTQITFYQQPGSDTVSIDGELWNYMAPDSQITLVVTCSHPSIEMIEGMQYVGNIGYNSSVSFTSPPFSFRILPGIPYDEAVEFKITITSPSYSSEKHFSNYFNLSYYDFNENNLKLTICSNGRIGFNKISPVQGSGIRFKSSRELNALSGLLIAYSPAKSLSCVYNRNDYTIQSPVYRELSSFSDFEFVSEYNDSAAPDSVRKGIIVRQHVYAWAHPDASDFCILRYVLYNNSSLPVSSFYAGLFFDWDIVNPALNSCYYNNNHKLSIASYQGVTTLLTGLQKLSDFSGNHYSFDLVNGGNGGIDIYSDFTAEERYQAFSEDRPFAGLPLGSDIAYLSGYGPLYVNPYDSIVIDFALMAAESEYLLLELADTARSYYNQYINNISAPPSSSFGIQIYPNPSGGLFRIKKDIAADCVMNIYDSKGKLMYESILDQSITIFNQNILKPGLYIINITGDNKTFSRKICIE